MSNQIPLSGLTPEAGGVLLPAEQGEILANAIAQESGALSIAGDVRTTSSRRTEFPIWKGAPVAEFVGEAGTKPVTGAEFGAGTLNVKKQATIVLFTDEMIEDLQNGDLNVLVDSDVRKAFADLTDIHVVGRDSGGTVTPAFDSTLWNTTTSVEYDQSKQDGLALAISNAMGTLEANGYRDFGVIVASDVPQHLRNARQTGVSGGGTVQAAGALAQGLYQPTDPFYGVPWAMSTNLNKLGAAAAANNVVAYVVSRPNLHVRVRQDIRVSVSNQASIVTGGDTKSLWQENLTGLRYEARIGFFVHDLDRAVVKITNAS